MKQLTLSCDLDLETISFNEPSYHPLQLRILELAIGISLGSEHLVIMQSFRKVNNFLLSNIKFIDNINLKYFPRQ